MMNRILALSAVLWLSACATDLLGDSETDAEIMSAAALQEAPQDQNQRRIKIPPEVIAKIGFDLNQFNQEGLLSSGQSIVYEYCIPRAQQALSVITTIDFTAEVKDKGVKVNCGEREARIIGSSHQDGFKAIMVQIASLPFVRKIEQAAVQ